MYKKRGIGILQSDGAKEVIRDKAESPLFAEAEQYDVAKTKLENFRLHDENSKIFNVYR